MPEYADTTRVKERSAVGVTDLALTDRSDGDTTVDEDDLDELIAELNRQASDTVDRYCRRTFAETTETISFDGNGRDTIRLPNYPVQSISEIKTDDGDVLASDEYRVRREPGMPDGENAGILEKKTGVWFDGWDNYTITYTWGYTTPPESVAAVAEELVIDALRAAAGNQNAAKTAAQSISMDGYSVTFDTELTSTVGRLSEDQQKALDDHRRLAVA